MKSQQTLIFGKHNWFLPRPVIPTLAIVATGAEIILGILLLLGWRTRITALLSGALLLLFAVTTTVALGIKAPLDFSVLVDAGGGLSSGHLRRISLQHRSFGPESIRVG